MRKQQVIDVIQKILKKQNKRNVSICDQSLYSHEEILSVHNDSDIFISDLSEASET
jgi:transposase